MSYVPGTERFFGVTNQWGRTAWFSCSLPAASDFIGVRVCQDKELTIRYLKAKGYRLPPSAPYRSLEQAKRFLDLHERIVIKPSVGERGRGVRANIGSPSALKPAISYAARQSVSGHVLLQKHLVGDEYRMLVIGGRLFAAVRRLPASVQGDGRSTIEELVQRKKRQARGLTTKSPLNAGIVKGHIGAEAMRRIPRKGEEVVFEWLRSRSLGGETEDVTDLVHPEYERILTAAASELGLVLCGFDLIIKDVTRPPAPILPLLELNAKPGFEPHVNVSAGQSRNPAPALLDHILGAATSPTPVIS